MAKKQVKAKKALAKTHVEKPRVEVTIRKKILGEAPEEYHFVLSDGKRLKSVYELIDELETMHEGTFAHHVNHFKNDFHNWISDVFGEHDLAEEIREVEEKMEMQRSLLKHMVRELMKLKKEVKAK